MSDPTKKLNYVVLAILLLAVVLGYQLVGSPEPPSDNWFQTAVIQRPEPVLVKFGATWCGPCRMLDGELEGLDTRLAGRASVVKVDVDQRPDLARHYGVSSIPRLLVFRGGKVVADRVGYMDQKALADWVLASAR